VRVRPEGLTDRVLEIAIQASHIQSSLPVNFKKWGHCFDEVAVVAVLVDISSHFDPELVVRLLENFFPYGCRLFSIVFHGFSNSNNRESLLTQVGLLSNAFRVIDSKLDIFYFGLASFSELSEHPLPEETELEVKGDCSRRPNWKRTRLDQVGNGQDFLEAICRRLAVDLECAWDHS